MKPEQLTFEQILRRLTVPQGVAFFTVLCGFVGSIFWLGESYGESRSRVQVTELVGEKSRLLTSLDRLQNENNQLKEDLAQVADRNVQAGRNTVDCSVIRQQIDRISRILAQPPGLLVFSDSPEVRAREAAEKADETALERMQQVYTQQYADCVS